MQRIKIAALSFYAAMAIATFGHAAAARDVEYAACEQKRWCGLNDGGLRGFVAGVFWPLYWSWEAAAAL